MSNLEALYASLASLVHDHDLDDVIQVLAETIDDEAARYAKRTGDPELSARILAIAQHLAQAPVTTTETEEQ
jgi:hypothetical protein